jgi:hypothetical protein
LLNRSAATRAGVWHRIATTLLQLAIRDLSLRSAAEISAAEIRALWGPVRWCHDWSVVFSVMRISGSASQDDRT